MAACEPIPLDGNEIAYYVLLTDFCCLKAIFLKVNRQELAEPEKCLLFQPSLPLAMQLLSQRFFVYETIVCLAAL